MSKAIVLINAELGTEGDLLQKLKKIDFVKETYVVFGVYDIVVMLEGGSQDDVKKTITGEIRDFPEVRSSLIMMVAD